MALSARSLFLFDYEVTALNQSLDFKAAFGGPEINATLNLGFYSASSLADEIERAMKDADPANSYTVTVNRNIMGGLENRITISTTGTFLSILFATGTNTNTNVSSLIGFNPVDYTGSTAYTGSQTTGTTLLTDQIGYGYLDDRNQAKVFGAVNVSAAGVKEAVVFNIQKFVDVDFQYEPKSKLAQWQAFFYWAIQQRPFDFTPEITLPDTLFQVTLERTEYESKGLGFRMREMRPNFPNFYQTGPLMFRIIEEAQAFITG